MKFLGLCDYFKISHTFLTKFNKALNLQIPLMALVLHGQSTHWAKRGSTVISKPRTRHSAPCKLCLQLQIFNCYPIMDLLTDLGFWITVDATRIIIIRLWTISVTEKERGQKSTLKSHKNYSTEQNGAVHSTEVIVPELQRGIA